jgi:hypothetical protein
MRLLKVSAAFCALLAGEALLVSSNPALASGKHEAPAPADPIALYGQEINFAVLRNGQEAGRHSVRFDRNGPVLTVDSAFHLQIDLLFVTIFRYRYQAQEEWRDGQLDRLTVQVDDDGRPFALKAERKGTKLTVRNGGDNYSVDAPLYPTNHWNARVLGENRVLNTLTGRVNRVIIRPVGREAIPTERGPVMTTRYAYSGELENQVWYDDAGRWVKMRFAGRDGSVIDYVCRLCQGGASREARN